MGTSVVLSLRARHLDASFEFRLFVGGEPPQRVLALRYKTVASYLSLASAMRVMNYEEAFEVSIDFIAPAIVSLNGSAEPFEGKLTANSDIVHAHSKCCFGILFFVLYP